MLTIAEAQQRTELLLTVQMLETLKAVEYELPSATTRRIGGAASATTAQGDDH
jgi:hypothetical protein